MPLSAALTVFFTKRYAMPLSRWEKARYLFCNPDPDKSSRYIRAREWATDYPGLDRPAAHGQFVLDHAEARLKNRMDVLETTMTRMLDLLKLNSAFAVALFAVTLHRPENQEPSAPLYVAFALYLAAVIFCLRGRAAPRHHARPSVPAIMDALAKGATPRVESPKEYLALGLHQTIESAQLLGEIAALRLNAAIVLTIAATACLFLALLAI